MDEYFVILIVLFIIGAFVFYITKDYKHIFTALLVGILLCFICYIVWSTPVQPAKMYNVTIRAHYIDGYSVIIQKDSIYENELPEIRSRRGGYYLDFAGRRTPAVIRFDYIDKKEYSAE